MTNREHMILARFIDGDASASDVSQLGDLLMQSDEAVELLSHIAIQRRYLHRIFSVDAVQTKSAPPSPMARLRAVGVFALAALIALALTAWFLFTPNPQPPAPSPSTATSSPVAMVSDLSADAVFANSSRPMQLGGTLTAGPIHLMSGKAQIMFDSTAVVDLTGPCEFEMTGPNRGRLIAGAMEAYVPQRARGFTVELSGGVRLVDLGTRFTVVTRADGRARVRVADGRVVVHRPGVEPFVLTAGQAYRLGDAHAWAALDLAADAAQSSASGFGGSVAATLTDPFGYDPAHPTSTMPALGLKDPVNWYAGKGSPGVALYLAYTLTPTTLTAGQTLVIDLYGRDLSATFDRDDDLDIELYYGGYATDQRVAVAASLAIPDAAPFHRRVGRDDFDADLTGRTFDRIRIVGRDSNGPRDPNYFTLVELRAAVTRPTTPEPSVMPLNEPADRSAATPAVEGPPLEKNENPLIGDTP